MTNSTMYRTLLFTILLALAQTGIGAAPKNNGPDRNMVSNGFEENKGQVRRTNGEPADFVRFRLVQNDASIFVLNAGIAYQFKRTHYPTGFAELKASVAQEPSKANELEALRKDIRTETFRMDMTLEGASPNARTTTEGPIAGHVNDYRHSVFNVRSFEKVTYHDVYPGIDWVVFTNAEGITYDFIVHPGADPTAIALRFQHYEELALDEKGALIHGNRLGRFTEEAPVSYQGGKEVATRFALEGDLLRFVVGDFDKSKPLTIDPPRVWGTYYGGVEDEEGYGCATDGNGNVYLAGTTSSTGVIAEGGMQNTFGGDSDAFLAKFNAVGTRLWATYYGGDAADQARGCAVDGSGNVYLAGYTLSASGISSGGHQNTFGGGLEGDAFLVKFSPNGTRTWATYYGGNETDQGLSCATDASGNVYLTGISRSTTGIASGGHQNVIGAQFDAFLAKFDPNGTRLWGTYYGGAGNDYGRNCSTTPDGSVLMTGDTRSAAIMATPGAHQTTLSNFGDGFLAKFDANGTRLWATYYGGTSNDFGFGTATDADGNIFLAGSTFSATGIAANGYQNTRGGFVDAFLVKFSPAGTRIWGTYYGGTQTSSQQAYTCAMDGDGNVYIAGDATSASGIASGGHQNTFGGGLDGFVVKFSNSGARLWGTYYGAAGDDVVRACAVDANGDLLVAGTTTSSTAIASSDGHSTTIAGAADAFLAKLNGGDGNAINEVSRQDLLRLLPNPNRGDRWTIDLSAIPGAVGALPVEVIDHSGKLVASYTVQVAGGNVVDVPLDIELPSGVYLVRVWVDGNAYTVRSVVQR